MNHSIPGEGRPPKARERAARRCGGNGRGALLSSDGVIWVQRIIWVVLAIFSLSVLYVVFSGGLVDDEAAREHDRREAERTAREKPAGEMAYDRYLPGGRQNSAEAARAD